MACQPADLEPAAETAAPANQPAPDTAAPAPAEPPLPVWSGAMTAVAEAFSAGLKTVPPEQQWGEMARIMAMTTQAAEIATGAAPPPATAMAAA